jgi:hypothetical protein
LQSFFCYNNHLPLSYLYEAHLLIDNPNNKLLGTQNLFALKAGIGQILFSSQSVFKGIYTKYAVTKNGALAPTSDYTVVAGKLVFNVVGNYTVTMTNDAIVSHPIFPAEVIVDIEVGEVGIEELALKTEIVVYPNPTRGELRMENGEWRIDSVEIYDMMGKKQQFSLSNSQLSIEHLPANIYFVRIQTETGLVTRKIIKK